MSKLVDLKGKRFSRLLVIERVLIEGRTRWLVVCDCGKQKSVQGEKLLSGKTKSCGCYRKGFNRVDLTGKRFGRLVILGYSHYDKKNGAGYWKVKCDCGTEKTTRKHALTSGLTQSCGCLHSEIVKRTDNKHKTHGMSGTHLYKKWIEMRERCDYEYADSYQYYGGKGISYCKQWKKFENFFRDMNNSFQKHVLKYGKQNTTLDRLDNNKNYSPSNCRWATHLVQGRNKSGLHFLTLNGETKCISEWAEKLNLHYSTIPRRLKKGCTVEEALTT